MQKRVGIFSMPFNSYLLFMNGNYRKVKNYWLDSRKPIDKMTSFRNDAFHHFFSTDEIRKS